MKTIPVGRDEVTLVDDEDYALLSRFRWFLTGPKLRPQYVTTQINGRPRRISIRMHQLILGGRSPLVDHIDRNPLNNQKSNLRPATHAENMRNRGYQKHSSKYKGVNRSKSRWVAHIVIDRKKHHLGSFIDESEAGRAYDSAAEKHFGQFARTNKMLGLLS